jgi:hypothetical protein
MIPVKFEYRKKEKVEEGGHYKSRLTAWPTPDLELREAGPTSTSGIIKHWGICLVQAERNFGTLESLLTFRFIPEVTPQASS